MQIVWTEQAISNLAEIGDYIEQDKPQAAKRVAAYLLSSVEHLAEFPQLGKPGRRLGTRELVVPPYVITYRLRPERLEILSVWHGRRRRATSTEEPQP
ncbi:MAG TPA: type II toxin-antitoxin system RelE/ParE family toxin [Terriglobia bacterium]|nr:type II toxin-antitoxin system RelE/ParE family toxin [Terriglobia bacterium]